MVTTTQIKLEGSKLQYLWKLKEDPWCNATHCLFLKMRSSKGISEPQGNHKAYYWLDAIKLMESVIQVSVMFKVMNIPHKKLVQFRCDCRQNFQGGEEKAGGWGQSLSWPVTSMATMAKEKACYTKWNPDIMAVANTDKKKIHYKPMLMFYSHQHRVLKRRVIEACI